MNVEALINAGWGRHEEDPQGVHDSLARSVGTAFDSAQLHAFSRLLTHVHAEHLDNRSAAVPVFDQLRVRFEHPTSTVYRPATTSIAILRLIDGEPAALDCLTSEERACALATAASALAWHQQPDRALLSYRRSRAEASEGLPDGSPAIRALAAAGNNLAVMLEGKADRDAAQTIAMVDLADAALHFWKQAGGWLEVERAHYRCARSRIQAGLPLPAIDCAEECLLTCDRNSAPPHERFFALAVGALACRAAGRHDEFERWKSLAAAQYGAMPIDERASCQDELVELGLVVAVIDEAYPLRVGQHLAGRAARPRTAARDWRLFRA